MAPNVNNFKVLRKQVNKCITKKTLKIQVGF